MLISSKINSQQFIKWHGIKINEVIKKRKEGKWLFFNDDGNVLVETDFVNDSLVGPTIYYDKADTLFTCLPKSNNVERFAYYYNGEPIEGDFTYTSDTTNTLNLYTNVPVTTELVTKIKTVHDRVFTPVYSFYSEKWIDYVLRELATRKIYFNKIIEVYITINETGYITKVEFPENTNLDFDQRDIFSDIFISMNRWQPAFTATGTKAYKLFLKTDAKIIH